MPVNVLFITVDQWRGDCLSAADHPVVDRLATSGVRLANHWANAAPCGPSRACLYTCTYLHHHRSVHNGTPLDSRFTNVALLVRQPDYDPVHFGYTDTSVDPMYKRLQFWRADRCRGHQYRPVHQFQQLDLPAGNHR
jgi:arylsulfatase A-like enzyme